MAESSWDTRVTLADMAKTVRDSKYTGFVNVLTERNDMLNDMPFLPANGILSHQYTRLSSLQTPQIINIGDGWQSQVIQWDTSTAVILTMKDRLDIICPSAE